jgi:hypothetical protein
MTDAAAGTLRRAESEKEITPAGSNWSKVMSYGFYYGVPVLYVIAVVCLVYFGSGWLKAIVSYGGWLLSYVGLGVADNTELSMRSLSVFAVASIYISTMRINAALKIPPEATLGQSIDRGISVAPILVILVMITWWKAKGWTIDLLAWKCVVIAFLTVLLQDFWTAGLAQKQIAAYRRRLDVV